MKLFTYIITAIAVILIGFNLTQVDFSDPFGDKSIVAVITIVCGLCAILLVTILRISKKIETLSKKRR